MSGYFDVPGTAAFPWILVLAGMGDGAVLLALPSLPSWPVLVPAQPYRKWFDSAGLTL